MLRCYVKNTLMEEMDLQAGKPKCADEITISNEDSLFNKVSELIEESRKHIAKAVNIAMVYTYYGIGLYIVNYEQQGNDRAGYGKGVLKRLSEKLSAKYGKGWSVDTLENARKLYLVYRKSEPAVRKSESHDQKSEPAVSIFDNLEHNFVLPWSHYLILTRIDNPLERSFYEVECHKQNWSKRELQRQVASSLFERLALSRNKDEIMRLATEGQAVEKPSDILRDPLVLEFVGLKPDSSYSENGLETAIIDKLQFFLLELGKGFLFEARQKRFTFNEDHFFVDLVLYNRLLQCHVLIDLKTDKLTHQDLGQMQMYVNYFNRYVKQDFEKPTIGILLCKQKNDALVELTLPEDANIYAQQYALCLPEKSLLQQKLLEWIEEYERDEARATNN